MSHTTVSVIQANGAFLLRQIAGPCRTLRDVRAVWPEAESAAPFFKNSWGDTLAQAQISPDAARKHGLVNGMLVQICPATTA